MQFQLGDQHASLVQMLPDSASAVEGSSTMQALHVALEGGSLSKGDGLQPTYKQLKTYRTSTKQLLHATRNCLELLFPGYNFGQSQPVHALQPSERRERYQLTQEEKQLMHAEESRSLYFWHSAADGLSIPDFFTGGSTSPLRLIWSGDEGSENFAMFQHLAHTGCLTVWWPDLCHRIHRRQANAFESVEEASWLLKKVSKVFRGSRGPWGTSRFGRSRRETRARMLDALDNFPDCNLLHCCLSGMARDLEMNAADLSPNGAIHVLKQHAGGPSARLERTYSCYMFWSPEVRSTGRAQMKLHLGDGLLGSTTPCGRIVARLNLSLNAELHLDAAQEAGTCS